MIDPRGQDDQLHLQRRRPADARHRPRQPADADLLRRRRKPRPRPSRPSVSPRTRSPLPLAQRATRPATATGSRPTRRPTPTTPSATRPSSPRPRRPGSQRHETTTNAYDPRGRLTSTTAPPASNSGGAPNQVTAYSYDAADELLTKTAGSGTASASTTSYCYDPNGEKTASVAPDGNTSAVARLLDLLAVPDELGLPDRVQLRLTRRTRLENPAGDNLGDQRPDNELQLRPGREPAHKRRPERGHDHEHLHAAEPGRDGQLLRLLGATRSATATTRTATASR